MKKQVRNRKSCVWNNMCEKLRLMLPVLKRNAGRIAYYGGVLAVLCAVAYAAEIYRSNDAIRPDELILPAVELETVAKEETGDAEEYLLPEDAVCLRKFSILPEWNADLRQWENHPATDYTFKNGEVPCLCPGTVIAVGESGVCGGFVEMQCGELLMRYASIVPGKEVETGMELEAGDRIGTVSDSMPCESMQQEHLHLEVYRNAEPVDFHSLL